MAQVKDSVLAIYQANSELMDKQIRSNVKEAVHAIVERQKDYEARNSEKLNQLEKKICDYEHKCSELLAALRSKSSDYCSPNSYAQGSLCLPDPIMPDTKQQEMPDYIDETSLRVIHDENLNIDVHLRQIVSHAKTILGLGPIPKVQNLPGEIEFQKTSKAIIQFLRVEISVDESAIQEDDIVEVFPAQNNEGVLFVQFMS